MRLCQYFQVRRLQAAFCPIQQFRDMQNRLVKTFACRQMLQAADIAADQDIRFGCRNIAQFAGP